MAVKRLSIYAILVAVSGLLCVAPLWAQENAADKNAPKENYPVFGVVLGMPGWGVNAVVGYDFGRTEVRLSGGMGDSGGAPAALSWGVQLDGAYNLVNTKNVVLQLGGFANYFYMSSTTPPRVAGVGEAVSVFLYGFFASTGLGLNFVPSHLQGLGALGALFDFSLQFGYMYRFN